MLLFRATQTIATGNGADIASLEPLEDVLYMP